MTLGRKLLGGFGVMLALVLLLSAAALMALRNVNEALDRAAKVTARKQYLAGIVNAAASEIGSLERASVLASVVGDTTHAGGYQQQFSGSRERLQSALADLRRLSDSHESDSLLQSVEEQAR